MNKYMAAIVTGIREGGMPDFWEVEADDDPPKRRI